MIVRNKAFAALALTSLLGIAACQFAGAALGLPLLRVRPVPAREAAD